VRLLGVVVAKRLHEIEHQVGLLLREGAQALGRAVDDDARDLVLGSPQHMGDLLHVALGRRPPPLGRVDRFVGGVRDDDLHGRPAFMDGRLSWTAGGGHTGPGARGPARTGHEAAVGEEVHGQRGGVRGQLDQRRRLRAGGHGEAESLGRLHDAIDERPHHAPPHPVQYSTLLMRPGPVLAHELRRRPQALAVAHEEIGEIVVEGDVDEGASRCCERKNSSTVMFISSTVMSVEASRTTGSVSPSLCAMRSTYRSFSMAGQPR
jgi:hypothetical protein